MITGKSAVTEVGGGGGGGVASEIRKAGSDWRGGRAVGFFIGTRLVVQLAFDFLAWQWWRKVLMEPAGFDA